MQMTKIHKVVASVIAVFALLALYIAFDRKSVQAPVSNVNNQSTSTSTTATTSGTTMSTQGTGSYKIEQVSPSESSSVPKPVPDLDRPVMSYKGDSITTAEAKAYAVEKVKAVQTILKTNPGDFKSWLNLGIYQKMGGDYDGAILSWQYAGRLSPTNYISLGDLGNLYAYFIKDNAQAEIYYQKAISKGPTQVYLYIQLAEVYRDIFKDMDKARVIVNQGLSKVPNDPSLIQIQASLSSSN
jgi:hypothetical protein